MKKNLLICLLTVFAVLIIPKVTLAAGISVSGGALKYAGDESNVTITASGATFNAFSGTISASGSVKVTACTPGDALWVTKPSGTGSFAGALTSATTSFRIATCHIKASTTGSGSISVSGVQLANKGPIVGTDSGSQSFSPIRKPTPPGAITVTSTSHPDQNTSYEVTTIVLSWDKPTGVTNYSYLLDQTAGTIPPATATNANTTASYDNEAVGTYYFHIRALNGDGWGDATHFKITIKEPDPKIHDDIAKPQNITITKNTDFKNDIESGTVTGFTISGLTLPNYMANIIFSPTITPPEGKLLSVKADANGSFSFIADFPFKAGNYSLTIQGQDNKTLTPISDPIHFEISQRLGGAINILTAADTNTPIIPAKKWFEKINWMYVTAGLTGLVLILAILFVIVIFKNKKAWKKIFSELRIQK